MVVAPIDLSADFFHPGAGGVRTSDGAMFKFSGLPRRDGYGLRMNMSNTGGTNDTATARMARHDQFTQTQAQIPNRTPIHTAAARILYDEEETSVLIQVNATNSRSMTKIIMDYAVMMGRDITKYFMMTYS